MSVAAVYRFVQQPDLRKEIVAALGPEHSIDFLASLKHALDEGTLPPDGSVVFTKSLATAIESPTMRGPVQKGLFAPDVGHTALWTSQVLWEADSNAAEMIDALVAHDLGLSLGAEALRWACYGR